MDIINRKLGFWALIFIKRNFGFFVQKVHLLIELTELNWMLLNNLAALYFNHHLIMEKIPIEILINFVMIMMMRDDYVGGHEEPQYCCCWFRIFHFIVN